MSSHDVNTQMNVYDRELRLHQDFTKIRASWSWWNGTVSGDCGICGKGFQVTPDKPHTCCGRTFVIMDDLHRCPNCGFGSSKETRIRVFEVSA